MNGGPTTFTLVATTAWFHDENPKAYAALVLALKDSMAMIAANPRDAAEVLLAFLGSGSSAGFSVNELLPSCRTGTRYPATPERVLAYAHFMHEIGPLQADPASVADCSTRTPMS